jgi:hypothetical protein
LPDCTALAGAVASWGGAVVPARVNSDGDGGWHKGSVKGWPAKASSDPSKWADGWFTWGGSWWAALCPRQGGLVTLDLDGPHAVDLFRGVRDDFWTPDTLTYKTPGHGGGMHVVWRWPQWLGAFSRQVCTTALGAQLDLRGEGTFLLLCGAPRPDLPAGAAYELVSRPGEHGPPPMPPLFMDWFSRLGDVSLEAAPSLGAKQLDPDDLVALALRQGGKVKADRHSCLFRTASWLRVRHGTRTFEALANELWRLVETYFDIADEEEHWKQEVIRVAKNASKYTEERDRAQAEAARASLAALRGRPSGS